MPIVQNCLCNVGMFHPPLPSPGFVGIIALNDALNDCGALKTEFHRRSRFPYIKLQVDQQLNLIRVQLILPGKKFLQESMTLMSLL